MALLPETLSVGATGHIDDSNHAYSKLNEVIDVVADFGADRTGVADSSTAIQAAVDATSAEGGIVFFPQGIYDIGTMIDLTARPSVNLVGVMAASNNDTKGSMLRTRNTAMTILQVDSGTLIHQGPTIEGLNFKTKTGHTGCTLIRMDNVNRWRIDRCAFASTDDNQNTAIQIDHTNDNAWWHIQQVLIRSFAVGIDIVNSYGGTIIGGQILCPSTDTAIGIQGLGQQLKVFGMFFDNGAWHIKGTGTKATIVGCKFEKPRAAGAAVELTGAARRNMIIGCNVVGDATSNNGIIFGATATDNYYSFTTENGGTGVAVINNGARNIGVVLDGGASRTRVQDYGATTPTGGLTGEIAIGTNKIWINAQGTWRSVAVT